MIKSGLLRSVAAVGTVLALSLLLLALSARDGSAQTFNPSGIFSLSSGAANTPATFTTSFNLPPQDLNFARNVSFIPPEWGVASASDLAIGTQVGTLSSQATLGILGAACAQILPVQFDLLNGSVNTADTISPLPAGQSNRLQPLKDDADSNGIPDGADKYPDYLNTLFPGITPKARMVGITIIKSAQNLPVVLNFVIFEPGTQLPPTNLIPDPLTFDPRLGFPSVTVLQDPSEPASPSAVTDFCAPLTANTDTFDNVRTNPGPGTYTFATFSRSQRDADGDGFENALDTCPFDPNNENPKEPTSPNPDKDGIDSACDNTSVFTPDPLFNNPLPWSANSPCRFGAGDDLLGGDCDGDFFLNRGDNCPQHHNPTQADGDNDGIGDECDTNPGTPDGAFIEVGLCRSVTIPGNGSSTEIACPNFQPFGNAPLPTGDGGGGGTGGTGGTGSTGGTGDGGGGTGGGTAVGGATIGVLTEEQVAAAKKTTAEAIFAELDKTLSIGESGLLIDPAEGFDTTSIDGSAPLVVVCAEKKQSGLEPVFGEEITFKIDSQPGSDASLEDETATTDADGIAETILNVGSTVGEIVVSTSSDKCGTGTTTVTVAEAVAGPDTGVGSLAPIASSIPAWAAIASGLGGAGLLGSLGAMAARIMRRRRQ